MNYELNMSGLFNKQVQSLSQSARQQLKQKLLLVKENPFRNKRLQYQSLFLFRLRLHDRGKSLRVVYLVDGTVIKILCILSRKKNYVDLEGYLKKSGHL